MEVLPSILTDDNNEFVELLDLAGKSIAKRIHVDFVDGKFADRLTPLPVHIDISKYIKEVGFDAHLMVAPESMNSFVEESLLVGFDRVILQIESLSHTKLFFERVLKSKRKTGIGIDLDTKVPEDPKILKNVSVVLVMSVKAGFGGQEFNPSALGKIKRLSELREGENYPYKICVDGGVTVENIKSISSAGADEVTIGRRLFEGDISENIRKFKKAALGK